MYYKLLGLGLMLLIGASHSQPHDTTLTSGLLTNQPVTETSQISSNVSAIRNKVQITVYYESLCPHSVKFFVDGLQPAVLKLGSHLDLQLVPYGKANTSAELDTAGRYSFTCQHGPEECQGNMVQACAIDVLQNNTKAVLFNSCLLPPFYNDTTAAILECGKEVDVPENITNNIIQCMNGTLGSTLLKSHGDLTHAVKVPYVPYLTFDGSSEHDRLARKDLMAFVCNLLNPKPPACHTEMTASVA